MALGDRVDEFDVGAVILATGFKDFDPGCMPEYGYGKYKNVMTGIEFERMNSASGPRAPGRRISATAARGESRSGSSSGPYPARMLSMSAMPIPVLRFSLSIFRNLSLPILR